VVGARIPNGPSARRGHESGALLLKLSLIAGVLAVAAAVLVERGVVPSWPKHEKHAATPPRQAPGLALPNLAGSPNVLTGAADLASLSAAKIRARLGNALRSKSLGRHYAVAVGDLTGRPVVVAGRPPVVMPASTMKLLTTTAALSLLGPNHRFRTTTRYDRRTHRLVLVGGGDPLLSKGTKSPLTSYPAAASLGQLAARTASRLRLDNVGRVRLGYDASLFTGPSGNPRWRPSYVDESVVTRTSALWVDQGRQKPYFGLRQPDPAAVAAATFSKQLAGHGIKVIGKPVAGKAAESSRLTGTVESAPLAQLVDFILETSNNEGAEVLLRHIAIAGHSTGSVVNGVIVERATLARLGLPLRGARIYDGSGLSRADRLPISTLVRVLQLASSPARPELRAVVTGLPIAGFSGTLSSRFQSGGDSAAGLVRVKTGTLTGVTAYVGTLTTHDGKALVFAVAADRISDAQTWVARATLDKIAARLTSCGCNS
jgi:serine-type D-Ala-D-Ala carboxypeptidase/endopeptidase (penicillin-binding protein 4)